MTQEAEGNGEEDGDCVGRGRGIAAGRSCLRDGRSCAQPARSRGCFGAFDGHAVGQVRAGNALRPTASSLSASPRRWRADVHVLTGGIDWQRPRADISRRAAGLLLSGAAWQLTTVPASAFKWATVERVAKDPALLKDVFDQDKTDAAVKRWKKSMNMVKGVDAVDAASYTAEFEEFKLAVGKVKKLKIGDEIIENPSDEQLLRAWKDEEVKRALAREEKGEEPLTRPVKDDQGAVVYLPPVVTKQSSPEALALGKHLKDIGATMYGAFWCSHCYGQKQVSGKATAQCICLCRAQTRRITMVPLCHLGFWAGGNGSVRPIC